MGIVQVNQDRRMAVFEDAYTLWTERRLTQLEAAQLLGVCDRTFRRQIERYESDGIEGLRDRRVSRASHRAAPVDEVMRMVDRYRTRHAGWNVRHYYAFYRREGGVRSYNWVRSKLQERGAVERGKGMGQGAHRRRREPAPWLPMCVCATIWRPCPRPSCTTRHCRCVPTMAP